MQPDALPRSSLPLRRHRRAGNPERWIVAVDPARLGTDETVAAIGRGLVLERFVAWRGADTMETVGRILQLIRELAEPFVPTPTRPRFVHERPLQPRPPKVARLIIDEVGLGGGVIDRLRETLRDGDARALGYGEVEAFNGGGSPVGPEATRFLNRRAEAYWTLRRLLELGEAAVPDDRKLFEELMRTPWKPTSKGQLQIEAKEDLRRVLGRSPDRADAASMFFSPRPRVVRVGVYFPGMDRPAS